MIEIRNVVKEFDGFRALDGLNMTVPDGAVYGLVGPNGAGKSTIIRHLTGIYRQDSGDVLVDGEQVFENPAVKNRIAYIPDDIFYFSNARIGEMASFYRSIYPQFDSGRFKKLGEVFDLDPKRQMRKLSKGMQKQAAFWMMMSLRRSFSERGHWLWMRRSACSRSRPLRVLRRSICFSSGAEAHTVTSARLLRPVSKSRGTSNTTTSAPIFRQVSICSSMCF